MTDPKPQTFTFMLREAAKVQPNLDLSYALRSAADMLSGCIDRMAANPIHANMIDLNGAWAYAEKVFKLHTDPQPTSPQTTEVAPGRTYIQRQLKAA
jgi:hypothetical protein